MHKSYKLQLDCVFGSEILLIKSFPYDHQISVLSDFCGHADWKHLNHCFKDIW